MTGGPGIQEYVSSDLLSLARPYLPMFLEPPKIVPPAGDQEFNTWAGGDILYSNDNRCNTLKIATCFSLRGKTSVLSPGPSYMTDFAGPNHVSPQGWVVGGGGTTTIWLCKVTLSNMPSSEDMVLILVQIMPFTYFFMMEIQLYLSMVICELWREHSDYWLRARPDLALAKVMVSQEKEWSRVVMIPQEMDMGCIIKEEIH